MNWVLAFLLAIRICHANIPHVFHFWHSKECPAKLDVLKSWADRHPKWQFKIWTDSDSPPPLIQNATIYPLKSYSSYDSLKKEILYREGGVWIDPDLICCKSIDFLTYSRDFFITKDGTSLIGSKQNHPLLLIPKSELPEQTFLQDSFLLPNQIFTTKYSNSDVNGICFRKFKNHPALNEELRKVQSRKQTTQREQDLLIRKISKIKKMVLAGFLLIGANGAMLILCLPYARNINRSLLIATSSLACLLIGATLFLSLNKHVPDEDKIDNPYSIHLPTKNNHTSKEDFSFLNFCNNRYAKCASSLDKIGDEVLIPRIVHVIWGGENPFPETSIRNIASWVRFHPSWVFKFWTDDPSRPVPVPAMEKHLFTELQCPNIKKYLPLAENWGEKSDLLRYEILFQEGGVYVDHDIECFRSFDSLNSQFDFYAPIEPLHESPLTSQWITMTNCLIGSRANHPILKRTMEEIQNHWDYYSKLFPDRDKQSSLLKTLGRTFYAFNSAFTSSFEEKTFIFPPLFVFPDHFPKKAVTHFKEKNLIFANHQWDNAWLEQLPEVSSFAESSHLRNKIHALSKFCKKFLKVNGAIFVALSASLAIYALRLKRKCQKPSFS